MPDIRVRDLDDGVLERRYVVRPFDHFDLDLATGNLALLLGASGCGKTTLLSMLASILTPTSGSIHVGDIEVTASRVQTSPPTGAGRSASSSSRSTSSRASRRRRTSTWRCGTRASGGAGQGAVRGAARRWWASTTGCTIGRASSRADSSNGSPSPARSRSIRRSSWPTSPPRRSTTSRSTASSGCCASSRRRDACGHRDPRRTAPPAGRPGGRAHAASHERVAAARAGRVGGGSGALPPRRHRGPRVRGGFRPHRDRAGAVRRRREPAGGDRTRSYFGELAPMFGLRRSATARAAPTPAVVTGYTLRDFRPVAASSHPPQCSDVPPTPPSANSPRREFRSIREVGSYAALGAGVRPRRPESPSCRCVLPGLRVQGSEVHVHTVALKLLDLGRGSIDELMGKIGERAWLPRAPRRYEVDLDLGVRAGHDPIRQARDR